MKTRLARLALICGILCLLGAGAGCDERSGFGIQSLTGMVPFGELAQSFTGVTLFNGDIPGGTGYVDEEDGVPREVGYCYSMNEEGPFTTFYPNGRCP